MKARKPRRQAGARSGLVVQQGPCASSEATPLTWQLLCAARGTALPVLKGHGRNPRLHPTACGNLHSRRVRIRKGKHCPGKNTKSPAKNNCPHPSPQPVPPQPPPPCLGLSLTWTKPPRPEPSSGPLPSSQLSRKGTQSLEKAPLLPTGQGVWL